MDNQRRRKTCNGPGGQAHRRPNYFRVNWFCTIANIEDWTSTITIQLIAIVPLQLLNTPIPAILYTSDATGPTCRPLYIRNSLSAPGRSHTRLSRRSPPAPRPPFARPSSLHLVFPTNPSRSRTLGPRIRPPAVRPRSTAAAADRCAWLGSRNPRFLGIR